MDFDGWHGMVWAAAVVSAIASTDDLDDIARTERAKGQQVLYLDIAPRCMQVQLDLRPGTAKFVHRRHQPLIAAVALDGDVQTPGRTTRQFAQVPLGGTDLRQYLLGQLQQLETSAGKTYRPGLAHEQRHANTVFQLAELVRQRRLGQVQPFGGLVQAVGFAQGMDGAQVPQIDHEKNYRADL
ncbi:hypothetical protein WR25_00535 [Diploscapter pachys]|uniref:Uncharacterized protein n=1 Tax=Diploscapter pachys TaxID=2018661 RepID=A0A2A2KL65_9BILA|nr:hypothetical protein WR25_00535 [Diploscapter pachys]